MLGSESPSGKRCPRDLAVAPWGLGSVIRSSALPIRKRAPRPMGSQPSAPDSGDGGKSYGQQGSTGSCPRDNNEGSWLGLAQRRAT